MFTLAKKNLTFRPAMYLMGLCCYEEEESSLLEWEKINVLASAYLAIYCQKLRYFQISRFFSDCIRA